MRVQKISGRVQRRTTKQNKLMTARRMQEGKPLTLTDWDRAWHFVRDVIFAAVIYIAIFTSRDIFKSVFDWQLASTAEEAHYHRALSLMMIGQSVLFTTVSVVIGRSWYSWNRFSATLDPTKVIISKK